MALCGREQPLTKTNEHGYWRRWAIADVGACIHQRHRSHPESPTGPNVLPPLISLCASTHRLKCLYIWWICFSPETNMSTSLLNILTGGKRQKTWWRVIKKTTQNTPTTNLEARKVISDRTCQGFMGDLLRVMKKKGENLEISFTETK